MQKADAGATAERGENQRSGWSTRSFLPSGGRDFCHITGQKDLSAWPNQEARPRARERSREPGSMQTVARSSGAEETMASVSVKTLPVHPTDPHCE